MPTIYGLIDQGDFAAAIEMLKRDPSVMTSDPSVSESLHVAAHHGALEVAKLLIEYGADVNKPDGDQRTPLHYASDSQVEVVRLLLQHGANPNVVDRFGYTPLVWSILECQDDNDEIFRLLLEHGAAYDLIAAAGRGDLRQVRAIFDEDPHAISRVPSIDHLVGMAHIFAHRAEPPLRDRIEIVRLLFSHGLHLSRDQLLKEAADCSTPEIADIFQAEANRVSE